MFLHHLVSQIVNRAKVFDLAIVAAALVVLPARAARADTLINFDGFPDNTTIDSQFVGTGVLFDGLTGVPGRGAHISAGEVTAHSGANVLINDPIANEFSGGPLSFSFVTPQKTVSLFAGYFIANPVSKPGTMTAFDANGNIVATDGPKSVLGGAAATPFSIVSTSANIAKVKVDLGPFFYTVIDDLQFGGGAPITPPSDTPVVSLTIPGTETLNYVDQPLRIVGNVTGQELLPNVKVTLTLLTPPPNSGFPVSNGLIPLANGGTSQIFDSAFSGSTAAFGKLLMGTYQVTVTATNLGGATGSASVTFTNLPSSVVATGNANSFGPFQFAIGEGSCQMAKFGSGSIAYFPATAQVIPIPTAIADKWFSVQDYTILRSDGRLGCPLALNDFVLVPGPLGQQFVLDSQNFERGRIYAPDGGTATYTPNVFANAINAMSTLGDGALISLNDPLGAVEIGIPTADPTMNIGGEEPTLLFQRFRRPGYAGMPNTLEIRGRNPKLYVERVGGSVYDFKASTDNPQQVPAGKTFDPTPTVWESYDCQYSATTGQYSCPNVARPHVLAVTTNGTPLYTTQSQIDNTDAYCENSPAWQAVGGAIGFHPTSWSAVPLKTNLSEEPGIADVTDVMLKGWVRSSHHAGDDLRSVHAHMHCGLAADAEALGITAVGCAAGSIFGVLGTIVGCALGAAAGPQVASNECWADWVVHVRPIPLNAPDPNFGLLRVGQGVTQGPPYWNLLSTTGDLSQQNNSDVDMGDMETESESDWQDGWVNLPGNHRPDPGNLVFLNGRWILDCAHPPFHSEIHPPNTHMVMETSLPPTGMGGLVHNNPLDPNGSLVTRSQIWSNQLYTGHPFSVTIWPPPRPSADAELAAMYLTFGGGGTVFNPDGSISFSFVNDPTSGLLPDPNKSSATGNFASDGLTAAFTGPPGGHPIEGSGQVIFPTDDPDHSFGAVGSFMANWYVGWAQ